MYKVDISTIFVANNDQTTAQRTRHIRRRYFRGNHCFDEKQNMKSPLFFAKRNVCAPNPLLIL